MYAACVCEDGPDATGLRPIDYSDPLGAYAAGWRDALGAAAKCGAYNADNPRPQYALCVREAGHGGMHDDMWKHWGDRHATAEQNRADAGEHSRWLRALRDA
jgi:hypothetical protein